MGQWNRRTFLGQCAVGMSTVALMDMTSVIAAPTAVRQRKFTLDLRCGSVGVGADQRKAIDLAHRHGFESVAPEVGFLAGLTESQCDELQAELKEKNLVWGAAGLPTDFRNTDEQFQATIRELPKQAAALQAAGVTRIGTWLSPMHDHLTYSQNFRLHAVRLRECCRILADRGLRFGMEYVGPKTLWASRRHSFIHTMAETKDLIAEMNVSNAGFILDSWHWYTAHESVNDLTSLRNEDIIACDLNDAPVGIEIDQQIDSKRELPCATGVIDLSAFLNALADIGYDGPIRAEPFNAVLNQLDDEPAVAATAKAMKQAFALVSE
ncbi:MAG: sugar phosphate isomerase/epimerase [Planctomycetaceae bacterium]|nr:sugar phosphate isomerase/epimerase [Planctomycetaceae bacterium]